MKVKVREFDNVGDRLRYIRLSNGMTRAELSKVLHIGVKSIQRYEECKFRPTYETLIIYSKLSGLPIDWIIRGKVTNEKR